MGSGGKLPSFWCDACQWYVPFSDYETCETNCQYCEAKADKARANAAEAALAALIKEVAYLRGERAAVVAWLREQRQYGTEDLLGQGFANVCGILANTIERGEHRRKEEA
jgi:hypothetical protein